MDPIEDELYQTGEAYYTWYSIKEYGYNDKNIFIILDHNIEKTSLFINITTNDQEQVVSDTADSYLQNLTSKWKCYGGLLKKYSWLVES